MKKSYVCLDVSKVVLIERIKSYIFDGLLVETTLQSKFRRLMHLLC